jgi:hypothetical protein
MTDPTHCWNHHQGKPKKSYRSQAKARQAAIEFRGTNFADNTDIVRPYQCPRCGQWHLSSKPYSDFADRVDAFRVNWRDDAA